MRELECTWTSSGTQTCEHEADWVVHSNPKPCGCEPIHGRAARLCRHHLLLFLSRTSLGSLDCGQCGVSFDTPDALISIERL